MFCKKTIEYATPDDMHLSAASLEAIILLNESIPEEYGKLWVTQQEMMARLIHCGFDVTLEKMQVDEAIRRRNPSNRLDKRKYSNQSYFRHSIYGRGSPKDRESDDLAESIMPGKNFSTASNHR